jgi:gas vesicle protein
MSARDTEDAVMGLVCGLVVGAALGILLAPASGKDTRHWIAKNSDGARRQVARLFDREELAAIVRQRGVRGLADVLRWRRLSGA